VTQFGALEEALDNARAVAECLSAAIAESGAAVGLNLPAAGERTGDMDRIRSSALRCSASTDAASVFDEAVRAVTGPVGTKAEAGGIDTTSSCDRNDSGIESGSMGCMPNKLLQRLARGLDWVIGKPASLREPRVSSGRPIDVEGLLEAVRLDQEAIKSQVLTPRVDKEVNKDDEDAQMAAG